MRLSADLPAGYGGGFSRQNLQQMRQFYLAWPASRICQTGSGKSAAPGNLPIVSGHAPDLSILAQAFSLPWSAYVRLFSIKNLQARTFYETEALRGGWSVRQLDRQIGNQFYERTALSHSKTAMLKRAKWPNTAMPSRLSKPSKPLK